MVQYRLNPGLKKMYSIIFQNLLRQSRRLYLIWRASENRALSTAQAACPWNQSFLQQRPAELTMQVHGGRRKASSPLQKEVDGKEDRERSRKLGFSSWVIILEGHPAQWASVLDEFCGPVNYKCKRRDFVSGGKKKYAEVKVRETFSRILGKMTLKLLLLLSSLQIP